MPQYVLRDGHVRQLKEGVELKDYLARHPGAESVDKPPSVEMLREWNSDGGCESLDGCWVEPDGTCEHGKPSWLKALGWI